VNKSELVYLRRGYEHYPMGNREIELPPEFGKGLIDGVVFSMSFIRLSFYNEGGIFYEQIYSC